MDCHELFRFFSTMIFHRPFLRLSRFLSESIFVPTPANPKYGWLFTFYHYGFNIQITICGIFQICFFPRFPQLSWANSKGMVLWCFPHTFKGFSSASDVRKIHPGKIPSYIGLTYVVLHNYLQKKRASSSFSYLGVDPYIHGGANSPGVIMLLLLMTELRWINRKDLSKLASITSACRMVCWVTSVIQSAAQMCMPCSTLLSILW